MEESSITQYLVDTFDGIEKVTATGNTFFFYGPEHKFPIVTLVTNDEYGDASNLNRPSVFRLNIGISKATYRSLFGSQRSGGEVDDTTDDSSYDLTALDQ